MLYEMNASLLVNVKALHDCLAHILLSTKMRFNPSLQRFAYL